MSQDKKDISEAVLPKQAEKSEEEIQRQPTLSEHTQSYLRRLSEFFRMAKGDLLSSLLPTFKRQGIDFDKDIKPRRQISLKIVQSTINMEAVSLNAEWGQFRMRLNILNLPHSNIKHKDCFEKGAYGNLYCGIFQNQKIVLKCIPLRSNFSRIKAIMECFLLKIASVAEIGPSARNYFGFDILMYEDCAEFAMETCEPILPKKINRDLLFWNLAVMHILHIAHLDIKPENVIFSPTYGKPVFIDFGLSKMVAEDIGLKTLTGFAGSINFCSKEMARCFWEGHSFEVDLYSNDLYSLEECIKLYKFKGSRICHEYEEQDETLTQETQFSFSYLKEYLLKFLLFRNNCSQFLLIWNNQEKQQCQKQLKKEVLSFLLELVPQASLRSVFQQLVDDSDHETSLYADIKFAYEVSHERLSSVAWLRDRDKKKQLSGYCQEYMNVSNYSLGNQEEVNKAATAELVTSYKLVRKAPFFKYAELLLEWMSYVNNKFEVDSQQRETAAKIYHQHFISSDILLKGRVLVQSVVRHILERFLWSKAEDIEEEAFGLSILRLYDYIAILDIGSVQEVIVLLERMLGHPNLAIKFKPILMIRVSQSMQFNKYRITLKSGRSRMQTMDIITDWLSTYRKILENSADVASIQQIYSANLDRRDRQVLFTPQFLDEFGFQSLSSNRILSSGLTDSDKIKAMIFLHNEQLVLDKHPRIMYFMSRVYEYYFFQSNSTSFGKQFLNILRQNIAQESILEEFSFSFLFEFQQLMKAINQISSLGSNEPLVRFNSEMLRIDERDIIIYQQWIFYLFNLLSMSKFFTKYKSFYQFIFTSPHSIVRKNIKSFIKYFKNSLTRTDTREHCFDTATIFSLVMMSKSLIPSLESEVIEKLFSPCAIDQIQCESCRKEMTIISGICRLQNSFTECMLVKVQMHQTQRFDSLLKYFFEYSSQLESFLILSPMNQKTMRNYELVMKFGQHLCCSDEKIENRYHGIERYYLSAKKYGQMRWFFKNQTNINFPILKTLYLLRHKGKGSQFIDFLLEVAAFPHTSRLMRDYLSVVRFTGDVLVEMGDQLQYQLLLRLKTMLKDNSALATPVATVLNIMAISFGEFRFKKKACGHLLKIVNQLFYYFKRFAMLVCYQLVCQQLVSNVGSNKRRWIFCNNRFVKLLVNENCSLPLQRKYKVSKDKNLAKLKDKIGKINCCKYRNKLYKIQRK